MSPSLKCPQCGTQVSAADRSSPGTWNCSGCGRTLKMRAPREADRETARSLGSSTHATAGSSEGLGNKIGRFEVRRELGAGAFGRVYLAYDPHLEREVALKVPHPGVLANERLAQRFLGEAKAAARLRHPHIVSVFDVGMHRDMPFLAVEFIRGQTLQEALEEGERPTPSRSAEILRQLAEALAYAHGEGIVHRDVKPANVMMDEQGRPNLMDFGLALREELESRLTQDGAVLGTPAYMSPEQASGRGSQATSASDQYSLGIMLYEMLCGEVPFHGPVGLILSQHIHQDPAPPRSHRPDIPRDLETICLKALAKRVEDRYSDCRALADDLRRWRDGEPITARRLSPWERAGRWCRRNPLLAGLTSVVAVLLCLIALVSLSSAVSLAAAATREREAKNAAVQNAVAAEQQSELAQRNAEESRRHAETARQLQARAEAEAERVRSLLYIADMNLARQAWERGQVGQVMNLLQQHVPAAGTSDLRRFEWYHLWALCRQDRLAWWLHRDLNGQPAEVTAVAFSPDGRRVASASRGRGNDVLVWQVERGSVQATRTRSFVPGANSTIHRLAFLPDGSRLAHWNGNQDVGIWDPGADSERGFSVARLNVKNGALSTDGRRYVAGLYQADETRYVLDVWDTEAGEQVSRLLCPVLKPPLNFSLAAVALNQDGTRAVAAGIGGSLYWWETATGGEGTPLVVRTESTEFIQGLTFSPEGNRVATASQEGGVAVWDLATNKTLVTWELAGPANCVAFSPDGRWLAAGTGKMSFSWPQDSPIHVWDLTSGRELEARVGHEDVVTGVAFSPDSRLLASSSRDGSVRVWDIPPLPTWDAEQELPVAGSLLAWNSTALLVGYMPGHPGGEVQLVDIPSGRVATLRGSETYATAVGLAPDGLSAAIADGEGTVTILDVATGKSRSAHKSQGRLQSLQFSPDSQWVCGFGSDGPRDSWHLWEAATGRKDSERKAPPGRVFAAWFGAAGRIVLAVQSRTELATEAFLWDLQAGGKLCDLPNASGEGGRFSPDGTRLAVIGFDLDVIRIYDTATAQLIHTVGGHRGQIRSLDFSPDGHTLVSASEVVRDTTKTPGDVILWDVATGRQRMAWPGAPPVAFSSDGRRLAWRRDPKGPIVVWRAATPDEMARTTVLPP